MKRCLKNYPEILFLDATYKLLKIRLPVYLFLVEDSVGESEVVGVAILVEETEEIVRWMLQYLKDRNPEFSPRVVMADKDFNERAIIKELFPSATVLICLFHSLRSFKREISDKSLALPEGTQIVLKEIFQSMCYARSAEEYNNFYQKFKKVAPMHVQSYFNKNWHNIRAEWVLSFVFSCGNFFNNTNNRVESFNGKLKAVIDHYSTLEQFIQGLFTVVYSTRNERNHKVAINFQKRKVENYLPGSTQEQYVTLLTSYAARFVNEQIKCQDSVGNIAKDTDGFYDVHSSRGIEKVSKNSCTCSFYSSMRLPCRHIFAVRTVEKEKLFSESLCDFRWTNKFYKSHHRVFLYGPTLDEEERLIHTVKKGKILSKAQKFREASIVCTKLAQLASEVRYGEYLRRLEILENIVWHWENGHETCVKEISKGKVYC